MKRFLARCLAFTGWVCIGLSERISLGSSAYGNLQDAAGAIINETAPLVMQGAARIEELEAEVLSLEYLVLGMMKSTAPLGEDEARVAIRKICEMARLPSAPTHIPEWMSNNRGEFKNG